VVRRTIKGWLKEVSSIVVITLLRKKLNDQEGTQSALIRNLVRKNIEDKEGNTNDIQHGPIT